MNNPTERKAYIITGPTSGAGRATAFEMAKHSTLMLVGRDSGKLGAGSRPRDHHHL
jgi:short-subunit dehydrogenase